MPKAKRSKQNNTTAETKSDYIKKPYQSNSLSN